VNELIRRAELIKSSIIGGHIIFKSVTRSPFESTNWGFRFCTVVQIVPEQELRVAASHLIYTWFESRIEHLLSWFRFSWSSSVIPVDDRYNVFLPIHHPLSSSLWTMYWSASVSCDWLVPWWALIDLRVPYNKKLTVRWNTCPVLCIWVIWVTLRFWLEESYWGLSVPVLQHVFPLCIWW